MDSNLSFLKLDKKLDFSKEKGMIDESFSMDFQMTLENNIIINLFDILTLISKKEFQPQTGNFIIEKKNEQYLIKINEVKSEYKLDTLLIKFFESFKEKLSKSNNSHINKLILIDDFLSLEIRLIIQQATLINGLEVIHIIDTNKALRFYIELYNKKEESSIDEYILIMIKYDNNLDLAIYTKDPIRKKYKAYKQFPNNFEDLKELKASKEGFILLEKSDENKYFIKIKDYISNLIENEIGEQEFQNIEKIYIFEAIDIANLNKKIFLGVSNSLNYSRTQECMAIFKIIDNIEITQKKIDGITIENYSYNLKKKESPILLELELPFEGCFYMTIFLTFYGKMFSNFVLITVYFNQNNYYYISLNQIYCNSIEFLFYRIFPETIFDSKNYENIKLEENFEDNEYIKRICLINVDRESINSKLVPDESINIVNSEFKNCTVIIGEKLNILSFFKKETYSKKVLNMNIYKFIEDAARLSSKTTLQYFEANKNKLNGIYFNVNMKKPFFDKYIDKGFDNNKIFDKSAFYIAYGKYIIFKTIFLEMVGKLPNFNYNESNINKFVEAMKHLEKFNEKCKNLIKNDDLLISQLFFTASLILNDYLNSKEYSGLKKDLFELIDFKEKGTIYNSAYENNLELILNLNKESFLYPIFLQFNSGFKEYENISSCLISKLTLQQIKLDLVKSLDNYGIRIFFNTKYFASTNLFSFITIYNEAKNFGKKLDEQELLSLNDIKYHKRTSVSFLQKHERFCHFKKIFNKTELQYLNSPRGYINFSNNQLIFLALKKNENKGEIGEALEYFLTNGQRNIINNLYYYKDGSYNFQNLFNINIFLEKTNEKLISILKDIPESPEAKETMEDSESNESVNNNIFSDSNKYKAHLTKENRVDDEKENEVDKYIEEKNKIINENTFRKFTFPRNTLYKYKYDYSKHKLVLDE